MKLKQVLAWWHSLGDVQKASKEAITKLVCTSEAIISDELLSWTSSGASKHEDDDRSWASSGEVTADSGQTKGAASNAKVVPINQ